MPGLQPVTRGAVTATAAQRVAMNVEVAFALLVALNLGVIIMNIPPVLTQLMGLYGASYTEISVLMSALLWTHAAMQLPAGMIADRLGIRRSQALSLGCMCLGSLIPAVTADLTWAVAGRMLTGVGTGMGWLATLKMLALCAPGGRAGAYQAFFAGVFSLGSISAYLLLPVIVRAGWRWAFLAPALLCLPLLALVPVLRAGVPAAAGARLALRRIVRIRSGWILGVYHALSYGSMLSLGNWVPSLLAEVSPGRAEAELAWGGALVMLVSGVSRLSGGVVIFRLSPALLAHGSIVVLCVLFAGLALAPAPALLLALALLTAWFGSMNFGALFHLASRAAAAASLGTLLGFVNLLGNAGAVAFTLLFGWSKDAFGSFAWGFAVLAVLAAAAIPLGLRVLSPGRIATPGTAGPA
jgi:cyanate permease